MPEWHRATKFFARLPGLLINEMGMLRYRGRRKKTGTAPRRGRALSLRVAKTRHGRQRCRVCFQRPSGTPSPVTGPQTQPTARPCHATQGRVIKQSRRHVKRAGVPPPIAPSTPTGPVAAWVGLAARRSNAKRGLDTPLRIGETEVSGFLSATAKGGRVPPISNFSPIWPILQLR